MLVATLGATFVDNGIPMLDTRLGETLGATFVDNGIPMFGIRFDDMLGIRFGIRFDDMLGIRFDDALDDAFSPTFGIRFDDAFSPAFDRTVWLCFGGTFCSRLCLSTSLFIKSIVSLNSVSNFSTGDIIIGSPLLSELNILSYCSA